VSVAVVTDSTSDMPKDVAQELGITVLPLYVHFGAETFLDSVDLTGGEFYNKLVLDGAPPKTSAPNVNDFVTLYTDLCKNTREIISLHIGSKMSGTYNMSATAAKEVQSDCHVEVIDSQSAAMGLGLLAIEAAKAARQGMALDQLTDMVHKLIPKLHLLITCDTVKYLVRGGHANKTLKILLASAMKINPLIEIKDQILPFGKVRGRAKAMDALCDYVASFPTPRSLGVEYATDAEDAKLLAARLEKMFPGVPIYTSVLGAVVGGHIGPRGLTVSSLERDID
jgi:DegV family protein with EDD domain